MTDFIDHAKLEAAMLQVDVAHFASKKPPPTVEDYATAVLALLDAETTEEWGVRFPGRGVTTKPSWTQEQAEDMTGEEFGEQTVSRRVIYGPWLPSEGVRSVASRIPQDDDDSTIHGLIQAEKVLRGIEHHWPADSVATAIQEIRSLRELCSENGLFDDDEEGGEKP